VDAGSEKGKNLMLEPLGIGHADRDYSVSSKTARSGANLGRTTQPLASYLNLLLTRIGAACKRTGR
jgi:hypothetical protein